MTTPIWESGHLYIPGDLVQPVQAPAPASAAITNPGFESGSTDWTLDADVTVVAGGFSGSQQLQFAGNSGTKYAIHDAVAVAPGTSITASAMYAQGAASSGQNTGAVVLRWLTSADVLVREDAGTLITSSSGGGWKQSTVTGVAPATAAKVQVGVKSIRTASDASFADNFTWNYVTQSLPAGLIYKAVQTDPGFSGSDEPAWPNTLGLTVVDNQVTWEAVATSRVTWTAEPLLVSGSSEPDWPTTPGEFVSDGTIKWECISRRVEDEKCPNTKVVAIMAGKVYAVDGDIVRFCATSNPLDWSSADDAGFLPTGLQQANANDMAVLAPYRGNLCPFNASSFQNWQVDPDPASMALLDQMDGIGSTWPKAATAVGNDLFFLSALGVRTVGISAGAENLAAGDVGMPVDVLVQDAMRVTLANGGKGLSTYYPSAGQYWLTFPDYPPAAPSITGDVPDGEVGEAVSGTYTVSGGVLPYGSITVLTGTFPPGLTLNTDGTYSGTYTTADSYSWTVGGVDADGTPFSVADTAEVTVPSLFVAVDNQLTLLESTDGGGSFPGTVATGLATTTSEVSVQAAGGRLFHFGTGTEGRSSADGASFSGCTGLTTTSGVVPGSGNLIKVGSEWQLYHFGLHVSTDGIAFSERTLAGGGVSRPVVDGTKVLAIWGGRFLQVSTDSGVNFTSYSADGSINTSEGVQRLLCIPGVKFVAFARDGSGNLYIGTSATGLSGSWTFGAGPATAVCHGVSRDPDTGRVVMVLQTGATWYSDDDCVTWNAGAAVPYAGASSFPPLQANNMIFSGGYFYFTAAQGAGVNRIYRSPDGVTAWAQVYTSSSGNSINSMCEFAP